jgi:hypothetical protein
MMEEMKKIGIYDNLGNEMTRENCHNDGIYY